MLARKLEILQDNGNNFTCMGVCRHRINFSYLVYPVTCELPNTFCTHNQKYQQRA